jgi:hypothetical protein
MRPTDTIPRLHHLVPHLGAQLLALADGETFEGCRLLYARTTEQLASEGRARMVGSRVDSRDAYWSPTRDLLQEAIRLGFVEQQPTPSSRRYLDEYRDKSFGLTPEGADAAALYKENLVGFTTLITNAAIRAHSYFRDYLIALNEAPIVCPIITEGEVAEARREGTGTPPVAKEAVRVIQQGSGPAPSVDDMLREMRLAVKKRFGKPVEQPTDKALAEALTDAAATASLRARRLSMGPTDLKTLRTWGTELLVVDQSRYVPGFEIPSFPAPLVIWLAGDLVTTERPDRTEVRRRVLSDYGQNVARALIDAYWSQAEAAKAAGSSLTAPYLSIYKVRAQAAYEVGVTRKLVDRVIEALAAGEIPESGVEVQLHLGAADRVPPSEPVYARGGRRRYQMTMRRKGERGVPSEKSTEE